MEAYNGANGPTEIAAQKILDFSYELNLPNGERQRFRVNATGIYGRNGQGIELTFRALSRVTPHMKMARLSTEEIKALTPREGIVVIAGATGSGKSTTMAAITRYLLEESEKPRKIVDIQAPIEYTYRDVMSALSGSASLIGQSEVGRHITSFGAGVHSALRRKPDIISVGEARDFETILASLEASLTGHLVLTTTHAGSSAIAVRRLLSTFPAEERDARGVDLILAMRFLAVQHLVGRADGTGVVPVREYIEFTDPLREYLLARPMGDWTNIIQKAVNGVVPDLADQTPLRRSLSEDCGRLYREGVISRSDTLRLGGLEAVKESDDVR